MDIIALFAKISNIKSFQFYYQGHYEAFNRSLICIKRKNLFYNSEGNCSRSIQNVLCCNTPKTVQVVDMNQVGCSTRF